MAAKILMKDCSVVKTVDKVLQEISTCKSFPVKFSAIFVNISECENISVHRKCDLLHLFTPSSLRPLKGKFVYQQSL